MNATTETFGKQRLLPLDLLRGVAALIVAAGHAGWLSHAYKHGLTIDFTLCVAFFFILSGYVLSQAYGEAIRSGRMTIRGFIFARFARLYPLHVATALVMAAALLVMRQRSEITPLRLFETLTLTQSLFSGNWSLNAPSWSIGAEFWGGLIMLALCGRSSAARAIALVVAAIALIAIDRRGGFIASYAGRYLTALACLAIGWFLHRIPFSAHARLGWLVAGGTFLAMMFPPWPAEGHPAIEFIYIVAFAAIVLTLARSTMPAAMQWVAKFSGDVSYGIYLWHFPLLQVYAPATPMRLVLFFASLIALSWFSFIFFERPTMHAIRQWLRAKPPELAPLLWRDDKAD